MLTGLLAEDNKPIISFCICGIYKESLVSVRVRCLFCITLHIPLFFIINLGYISWFWWSLWVLHWCWALMSLFFPFSAEFPSGAWEARPCLLTCPGFKIHARDSLLQGWYSSGHPGQRRWCKPLPYVLLVFPNKWCSSLFSPPKFCHTISS